MPTALLDHDQCYSALASRDGRFDGRFFVGVRTTGVYCRPVCPSRTPKAANVDFYAHPAAAEDAGFRPCRRCHPESAPGSPRWRGGAEVVERALALIDAGALDDGGVADLATRLHVGDRHLRRLFREQVGTTPDAVARSRRAHLAKRLLVETDWRIADVAFAAGFGSVRQCNDVVREVFRATPSEVRRGRSAREAAAAAAGGLALDLAVSAPLDPALLLDWFSARAVPGVEEVTATTYRRHVAVPAGSEGGPASGTITLTPAADHVGLTVDVPTGTPLGSLVALARRLFGLDADVAAIDAHLAGDPLLGPAVQARPGLRVPGCWDGFEAAVRAVIGQQISVAAARTVLGRIAAAHGTPGSGGIAFPGADAIVAAPLEELGIFARRAETIRALARAVVDGRLALDGSLPHADLVAALVAMPGIGSWTAEYLALRLGEPDAFPAGDLHLLRVLGATTEPEARRRAEPWRPWRAHAAMHCWHLSPEDVR